MRSETVVRIRTTSTTTNRYNVEVPDDEAEKRIRTLAPAEPVFSAEPDEVGRVRRVQTGWKVYLDECEDVTSADQLRVRGIDYNVDGEPESWMGGGLVVHCTRTAG